MNKSVKNLIFNELKLKKNINSDKELANYLEISPQKLYNWRNDNNFDIEILYNKTKEFDFNPIFLITGKGSMYTEESPPVHHTCQSCTRHEKTIDSLNDTISMYKERLEECEDSKKILEGISTKVIQNVDS